MRPNVLWIMTDQHHADCLGCAGHPDVRTPAIDRIAADGVRFTRAFANNPICSPSRISFMTGQYVHTHGMFGNDHAEWDVPEPDTLASVFRRNGYRCGLFGKSHTVRRWDEDGFERIRYTDLCDATRDDPRTCHYFDSLVRDGLGDLYEEGSPKKGQEYTLDGSAPARLPYTRSIEHYTGEETLQFLQETDDTRPLFVHMSFQRPHAPIAPAAEYFGLYDPDALTLPDSAFDYFRNRFRGKPEFMRRRLENGCGYPLADPDPRRLRRCLASYYALITCIDMEIGRVLDLLERQGRLADTVVVFTADHGDFAGDHGLFHKNFGLYDSICRIPFILRLPGGPAGMVTDAIVESVDLYPTLCEACSIPLPSPRDGRSLMALLGGTGEGRHAAFTEWDWGPGDGRISAVRTADFRLVYYGTDVGGELYDHRADPGETRNLWDEPGYAATRLELLQLLLDFTLGYAVRTDRRRDRALDAAHSHSPTTLIHKRRCYWSRLEAAATEPATWPPPTTEKAPS